MSTSSAVGGLWMSTSSNVGGRWLSETQVLASLAVEVLYMFQTRLV